MLINGDCLDILPNISPESVDLIFCDLPYGQTSCKWDCKIDLEKLWIEFMRVKKLHTPLFFTTTTKFGVELIMSAPKKCFFRYDIVWVKSAPAGFLSAKKMPMRKHEMVYVFYEKLPLYDLSSHKHKFIKEIEPTPNRDNKSICYGEGKAARGVKYTEEYREKHGKKEYQPPLPTSVIKEEEKNSNKNSELYGEIKDNGYYHKRKKGETTAYEPPLPTSVIKETDKIHSKNYETDNRKNPLKQMGSQTGNKGYEPPLPNSILEIKSTRGKHSTEKPVALMEWILKYYSKEGDTILDPTMGSGSTGVACKNLNREFIGIEKDEEIYAVAIDRIKQI